MYGLSVSGMIVGIIKMERPAQTETIRLAIRQFIAEQSQKTMQNTA